TRGYRDWSSDVCSSDLDAVGAQQLEHILELLRAHGITEVVVTLAYLGADIRNRFGDGSDVGMSIEYVVEDSPLGTAGSVRNAAQDRKSVVQGKGGEQGG